MMKRLITLLFCFTSLSMYAQEVQPAFDGHKWVAPYHLPTPTGWGIERFPIPISFAPQIAYKGVEDIRFAPGWANKAGDEYWTYAFLWYLDGLPKTNAKIIAKNLKNYYTGLIKVNSDSAKAASEKPMPVITSFREAPAEESGVEIYYGTIEMRDYMQRKRITLNCMVRRKYCTEEKKTILFYELSPKPFTHNNWVNLNQLWLDFKCKKD